MLPTHPLSSDSEDAIKLATAIIATLSALALGLLIDALSRLRSVGASQYPRSLYYSLFCALSVASAVFLIVDMEHPFVGSVQVSNESLRDALEQLGR
jgi:hypothetical protein